MWLGSNGGIPSFHQQNIVSGVLGHPVMRICKIKRFVPSTQDIIYANPISHRFPNAKKPYRVKKETLDCSVSSNVEARHLARVGFGTFKDIHKLSKNFTAEPRTYAFYNKMYTMAHDRRLDFYHRRRAVWSTRGSRGKGGGREDLDPRKSSSTNNIWNLPDSFTPEPEKPFASYTALLPIKTNNADGPLRGFATL